MLLYALIWRESYPAFLFFSRCVIFSVPRPSESPNGMNHPPFFFTIASFLISCLSLLLSPVLASLPCTLCFWCPSCSLAWPSRSPPSVPTTLSPITSWVLLLKVSTFSSFFRLLERLSVLFLFCFSNQPAPRSTATRRMAWASGSRWKRSVSLTRPTLTSPR